MKWCLWIIEVFRAAKPRFSLTGQKSGQFLWYVEYIVELRVQYILYTDYIPGPCYIRQTCWELGNKRFPEPAKKERKKKREKDIKKREKDIKKGGKTCKKRKMEKKI